MRRQIIRSNQKLLRLVLVMLISAQPLLASGRSGKVEAGRSLPGARAAFPLRQHELTRYPPLSLNIPVTQTLFLPVIFRDYIPPYVGAFEIEPNNTYTEATGPLQSDQTYLGYATDTGDEPLTHTDRDYYKVYLPTGGAFAVTASNVITPAQLHLYQGVPASDTRLDYQTGGPTLTVTCPLSCTVPGWYYILVYSGVVITPSVPYSLTFQNNAYEIEPNKFYTQANGPLLSNRLYQGFASDTDDDPATQTDKDYYKVYLQAGGALTIAVTNTVIPAQLHLYQGTPTIASRIGYQAGGPNFTLTCPISCTVPGWYYILLFSGSVVTPTLPYSLTAQFP